LEGFKFLVWKVYWEGRELQGPPSNLGGFLIMGNWVNQIGDQNPRSFKNGPIMSPNKVGLKIL